MAGETGVDLDLVVFVLVGLMSLRGASSSTVPRQLLPILGTPQCWLITAQSTRGNGISSALALNLSKPCRRPSSVCLILCCEPAASW